MWRVTTTDGVFAVKVMRSHVEAPDFSSRIEAARKIEMAAFRAGVPCPEPRLTKNGDALFQVEEHWLRAHRWCDGFTPNADDHLEDVGVLLAEIHSVGSRTVAALDDRPRSASAWTALVAAPELPGTLREQIREAAPELAALEAATMSGPGVRTVFVESHGDLDPKNTLVSSGRLLAVDWDAAGPRPIAQEAVTVALDWAKDVDGFLRVLRTYAGSSPTILSRTPWVFGGWVAALTGWLAFNLEQRPTTLLGLSEATTTCDRLLRLWHALDDYRAALDEL
ncbi:MAG: phosphotransferase [Gordonia polyisoprenivorans]|nr:phosphotransferase [Gordonia polyisoprenivorans]